MDIIRICRSFAVKILDGGGVRLFRNRQKISIFVLTIKKFLSNLQSICFQKVERSSSRSLDAICSSDTGRICAKELTSRKSHRVSYLQTRLLSKLLCMLSLCFVQSLKRSRSGYVLIVLTCFIPVVLLGIKYAEKLFDVKDEAVRRPDNDIIIKRCSREAALSVARNWNPGLTLGQQREAVYKVADAVYNAYPCYFSSVLSRAVPGVVVHDTEGNAITMAAEAQKVEYDKSNKKYEHTWTYKKSDSNGATWNSNYAVWRAVDKATDPDNRQSCFDEMDEEELGRGSFVLKQHDICVDPHPATSISTEAYPTDANFNASDGTICYKTPSKNTSDAGNYDLATNLSSETSGITRANATTAESTYTTRKANTEHVNISISDDAIKVRTDNQTAAAKPAKCDVDIVLAIPVNGAACNVDNRDTASDTAGTPCSYSNKTDTPEDVTKTPIYQMGQALKNFVKEHFYHTRGVNMSLIPYSGKLSISPDRATIWTVAFPQFVDTSPNTQLMIGACLYGTSGIKNAALKQTEKNTTIGSNTLSEPYYWGTPLATCPIMCRKGTTNQSATYGNNYYVSGLLLDTTNPNNTDAKYKYLRMNLNPCYMGYANMPSMRCEKQCTHFLPNPYYMIEPTADLVKIYEMCNALYPIYDTHNVSNFVFAALEWANNMFQSWTNDPSIAAKDGSGAGTAGATSDATLSRPSKTTSGRKKAVILLVNKPDWFEPGEMTYLGFNNDFSEVPTVLSDKIDFSIDYSDTSKQFLDGSNYDGTLQGANKILKCSVSGNTYTLTFPHSGLILVKVKPTTSSGTFKFTAGSSNTTSYTVYDEKIFALQPSQITDTTVKFTVSGLTVVSVEITNRPYSSKTAAATYNSTDTGQINIGNIWFNGCEEVGSETTVSVTGLNDLLTANAAKTNGILTYTGSSLTSKSDTLTATATTGSAAVNETISGLSTGTKSGTMFSYKRNSSSTISETIDFWKNICSNSANFGFTYTPKASGTDEIRLSTPYYADITFKSDYGKKLSEIYNNSWGDICYCSDTGIFHTVGTNCYTATSYNGIAWTGYRTGSWLIAATYSPAHKQFFCITDRNCANIWRSNDQYTAIGNVRLTDLPWNIYDNVAAGHIAASNNGTIVVSQGLYGNHAYSTNGGNSWSQLSHGNQTYNIAYSSGLDKFLFKCTGIDHHEMPNPPTYRTPIGNYTNTKSGCLEGPCCSNNAYRFVSVDDSGSIADFDYSQKKTLYCTNQIDTTLWRGIAYTSKGNYYVIMRDNGETRTYNGAGTVSGSAAVSSHTMKYGSTTTTVANSTTATSMTIPASSLTCSSYNSHYIDVTTTGACANSASLGCYTETDTLTLPSGITSGTVRFTTAMKNTRGKITCTTTGGNTKLTAAGSLDVTATGRTSLAYRLDGLTASSAQMINCYMPCETGGSIDISGILSYAKQRKGTIYLKAKVRSGQTGKVKFTNVSGNTSEQNVTNSSGAEYGAVLANISGTACTYSFPSNNALINTQKVSARHAYSIPAGGTLSWNSFGKRIKSVTLTVAPTTSSAGSITFSNLSNNATYNQNIASQKDITVDGSYLTADNVKYTLTNAVILSASVTYKLLQPYQFTKPSLPSKSSYIDFGATTSDSKPVHTASGLALYSDGNYNGTVPRNTKWDSTLGYWYSTAGSNNFFDKQPYAKGDLFFVTEDINSTTSTNAAYYGVGTNVWHTQKWSRYVPGINRLWSDYIANWPAAGFSISGKAKFIVGGITQPINAVLYNYGVNTAKNVTSTTTDYISPSTDFNRTVLKRLTTDMCTKLKNAGVRVYVVKYCKQTNWNALTRSNKQTYNSIATAHSYTEIDACATSTGGKVYNIGTAADDTASNGTSANATALKETLDAIASDIKAWAGYEEARNVTN